MMISTVSTVTAITTTIPVGLAAGFDICGLEG